jgi:hypothetical protein
VIVKNVLVRKWKGSSFFPALKTARKNIKELFSVRSERNTSQNKIHKYAKNMEFVSSTVLGIE